MKKTIAFLLSLVMLCTLTMPALAASAPAEDTSEPVPAYTSGEGISIAGISGILGGVSGGAAGGSSSDELKAALGGVPGQIGVMVNGKYVRFGSVAPEISKGRTMIPVRALVKTLGGKVSYQDKVVTFVLNGYTYQFTIGSTTVTVTSAEDGGKRLPDIVMDCAPYIKHSRTYVPIRFIAKALGYKVGWDEELRTAILLDRDALADQIDGQFTIINKAMQGSSASALEEGKNIRADVKGNLTVTAFDTINGDKTYEASLTAAEILGEEAANVKLSVKLSDNVAEELEKQLAGSGTDAEESAALLRLMVDGLEDMEVILNRKGQGWLRMAALDELAGTDNVWMDLGLDTAWSGLASGGTQAATVGSALAASIDVNSVESCVSAGRMAGLLYELYGDDKFTTSGGESTRTMGADDLMAVVYHEMGMSEEDIEAAKAAFKEYRITMKVDGKGGVAVTFVMETESQAGVPAMRITMDTKQDAGNAAVDMSFHIANLCEGKLTLTQTWGTTTEVPETQPPEGAVVVDSQEALNG